MKASSCTLVLEEVEHWLTLVRRDLDSARALLALMRNDHAAFFAQQAAEKTLKAALTSVQVKAPRSHDLARLTDLLPPDMRDMLPRELLNPVTTWETLSRYGPQWTGTPSASEIEQVLDAVNAYLARRNW